MSETETHIGKLKKLKLPKECITWKDKFLHLQKLGFSFEEYDIEDEWIYGEKEGCTITANGDFYVIIESKSPDYKDILEASVNIDGTISYTLQFYNGGCSFGEALESALKNIDKPPNII